MKNSLKLIVSTILVTLTSCGNNLNPTGIKINLNKSETFGLIDINADKYEEIVLTNADNAVVLLGVDNCQSCINAKSESKRFADERNVEIYYVSVLPTNYNKLVEITSYNDESVYNLPQSISDTDFPRLFFYKEKSIITVRQTSIYQNLDAFIFVN